MELTPKVQFQYYKETGKRGAQAFAGLSILLIGETRSRQTIENANS